MDTIKCKPGTKIYYDTFSGLVKGIYVGKHDDNIVIKITAKQNKCYECNKIITLRSCNYAFPRQCYHRAGIFRYAIYPNYVFVQG